MPITIRLMSSKDLDAAMALKDVEGWNQTREDWDLFLRMAPESCLVAVDGDLVVGTVVGINYADQVAWIGMMLVNRAYRGQGISKRLMTAVITTLQSSASIKLDATPAGFPVYRQLGFEEEYTLLRMVATDPIIRSVDTEDGEAAVSLTALDLDEIYPLDSVVFGADRREVLLHALRSVPSIACRIQHGENTEGYLLARTGTRYVHLGPLVAENDSDAKSLLSFALGRIFPAPLVIDVPKGKQEWVSWLESRGFRVQRELFRMYLKSNEHAGDPGRIYAVCGPELG